MPDVAEVRRATLADGRTVAYRELGDPGGTPVLSCHGGLCSGLDIAPADDTARDLGLRLISPDRPGIGGSSPSPGRAMADWPADVAELADQVGVESFGVLGWSLGGAYAAITAHAMADRVTSLTLVASTVPLAWDGALDELNAMDRRLLRMTDRSRPLARTAFATMHLVAAHAPQAFARSTGAGPVASAAVVAAMADGLTHADGMVDEYVAWAGPWGFEPSELTVPTRVVQGDADELVPLAWGERLAAAIPGADLTVIPGGTHFLGYEHWDVVLGGFAR